MYLATDLFTSSNEVTYIHTIRKNVPDTFLTNPLRQFRSLILKTVVSLIATFFTHHSGPLVSCKGKLVQEQLYIPEKNLVTKCSAVLI